MIATIMIYPVARNETKTVAVDFRLPSTAKALTLLPSARVIISASECVPLPVRSGL